MSCEIHTNAKHLGNVKSATRGAAVDAVGRLKAVGRLGGLMPLGALRLLRKRLFDNDVCTRWKTIVILLLALVIIPDRAPEC